MPDEYLHKIAVDLMTVKVTDVDDYYDYFKDLLNSSADVLDEHLEALLKMLAGVCSFHLVPENKYPYSPMCIFGDKRSMVPDDLNDEQLDTLRELSTETLPAILAARFCDVLWIRRKDYKAAETAISSYLTCAEKPDLEHWFIARNYCRRAARIAQELGKRSPQRKVVYDRILALYETSKASIEQAKLPYLPNALIEILIEECDGADLDSLGMHCEELGDKLQGKWVKDEYYKLAARIFEKANKAPERLRANEKLGNVWETDADQLAKVEGGGEGMRIADSLKKAIEAYRSVGNKVKADELLKKLQQANLLTISQMKKFEFKVDASELARESTEAMKGKIGMDAITALATLIETPIYQKMLFQEKDLTGRFPMQRLVGTEVLTVEGNVTKKTEGGLEEKGPDTLVALSQQYGIYRNTAFVIIDNARRVMLEDESIQWKAAIEELLSDNPFVPEGRKDLFLKALIAGARGDLAAFLHLIIPQLENSVRKLVGKAGGKTTSMKDGVMHEIDLNQLLTDDNSGKKEAVDALGEDVVWDLRMVLVEKAGPNLRNRICHGLAEINEMDNPNALYILWLTLHILAIQKGLIQKPSAGLGSAT